MKWEEHTLSPEKRAHIGGWFRAGQDVPGSAHKSRERRSGPALSQGRGQRPVATEARRTETCPAPNRVRRASDVPAGTLV